MTSAAVRAIRGAVTCDVDSPEAIGEATRELMTTIMTRNELHHDDVISVIFTTTADLVAAFPATAARSVGFGDVPLICAREIPVPGAMPRCIRVLLHCTTERARDEIHHIYLRDARALRDDLPE